MDQGASDIVKLTHTCIKFLIYWDKNVEFNKSKVNRAGTEKQISVAFVPLVYSLSVSTWFSTSQAVTGHTVHVDIVHLELRSCWERVEN